AYPTKFINSVIREMESKRRQESYSTVSNENVRATVCLPFNGDKAYQLNRVFAKHSIRTALKAPASLGNILTRIKDNTKLEDQSNAVHQIGCNDCNEVYIG